ncbi:shikimate dehydrogenase [Caulobacter sp. KR2-114]|uniref:shikimate dehydrogenase n=1 Tax=Caulobacter sp. KR2-114 TaxID=3400912 RepID=UPI003C0ABB4E
MSITAATVVAGVAGQPVKHSLSPLLHNAWLAAAGIDGVYVAFGPPAAGFSAFARGLRGGTIRGLNVTVPFKEDALALADQVSDRAAAAGAANLLLFEADGAILADNTDGVGLLSAFAAQAPGFDPAAAPVVILGAGGAARGAAAAFLMAGAPEIRLVNRTVERAEAVAQALGPRVRVMPDTRGALPDAGAVINATTLGLNGGAGPEVDFAAAGAGCVVMDMVYKPLETAFLQHAAAAGLRTVDGLEMLIGQARPSFEAFYGAPTPAIDARSLVLKTLGQA